MAKRVAVVEDEAELAGLIDYNLSRGGYETRIFPGAASTLDDLAGWRPDMVILDVMLPENDGFSLCRQIREHREMGRVPVLFLTARSGEVDRVLGLEIGGDDYMTKPFSPRELVARVKAHLRREDREEEPAPLTAGPLRLERASRRVFIDEREVELTSTEFKLLEFFLLHPGRAFSREQLLSDVWGDQRFITSRTVDVHVRRLREQIEKDPAEPALLHTVRGFGYRFEALQ